MADRYGNVMTVTPLQRTLSLAAVISTSFGVGVSFGIGFPLTGLTFEVWSQPKWMIGLAGAVPAIALLLVLPILPPVVQRLGPVVASVGGCIAGGMGFIALYAFSSPWAWLVIRLLMSAGFALPWLAGETWLNSVAKEEIRGRVIAIYAIAYFAGYAVGPLVLQALGIDGFVPCLAAAAITSASCLPILAGRRLAPVFNHDGKRKFVSTLGLAPAAMIGAFIGGFAEITNLALIPNVALVAGQSQEEALGLLSILTIGGILLQFPIGWLSDSVSRHYLLIGLAIAYIVLALSLPVALASLAVSAVLVFCLGGIILGFYSLGLAMVGERVEASDLAAANAAFIVMYQVGALLGPLIAGIAMTMSPVMGFVSTTAGLMLASILGLVLLRDGRGAAGRMGRSRPPGRRG